jgi:hypothetical protein
MYTQIYMYMIYLKYNFNTYIKIHPYVTIKYIWDVINLVTIATNGTYQAING